MTIETVDVNAYQGTTIERMNLTVSYTDVHAEMTIPVSLVTI